MSPRNTRRSVFEVIPGIGPSLAKDLEDLGFKTVENLRDADAPATRALGYNDKKKVLRLLGLVDP